MEQKTEFVLDMLTSDSVSILRKNYIEFGGQKQYTGNTRNAYMNSTSGRKAVAGILPSEYYNAVIAVWGSAPTVQDPESGVSE